METWHIKVNMLHCPFKLQFYGDSHCSYNHLRPCSKDNCLIREARDEEVSKNAVHNHDANRP